MFRDVRRDLCAEIYERVGFDPACLRAFATESADCHALIFATCDVRNTRGGSCCAECSIETGSILKISEM